MHRKGSGPAGLRPMTSIRNYCKFHQEAVCLGWPLPGGIRPSDVCHYYVLLYLGGRTWSWQ